MRGVAYTLGETLLILVVSGVLSATIGWYSGDQGARAVGYAAGLKACKEIKR